MDAQPEAVAAALEAARNTANTGIVGSFLAGAGKVAGGVSSGVAAAGTTAGYLLSGGVCRSAELWQCAPWFFLGCVLGVCSTLGLIVVCAACAGGQYLWFVKNDHRRQGRRHRRERSEERARSRSRDSSPEERRRSGGKISALSEEAWDSVLAEEKSVSSPKGQQKKKR
jgi:hypothetical protein